jgi:hypothetical protein
MSHTPVRRTRRAGAPALMLALLMAAAQAAGADPPSAWKIQNPGVFRPAARAAVRFTHAAHQGLDGVSCTTCHHVFKNGRNILDPSTLAEGDPSLRCASCHATARELRGAYHGLCIGCHDARKRDGGVTGPRTCGECHAWSR